MQNYENLCDTKIDTFFIAFKEQIKSTHINSENVIGFVRGLYIFVFTWNVRSSSDGVVCVFEPQCHEFSLFNLSFAEYYKDFYMKLEEQDKVPSAEYVYIYSLFLHFSCILHADTTIQQICNNMVRKNQEMIEKFLDYLFKVGKCERAIVQTAIEEAGKLIYCHFYSMINFFHLAEACDLHMAHISPITRNLQSILSNTSPQTPKSKMLNTWNLENRNLKVCSLDTFPEELFLMIFQLNLR